MRAARPCRGVRSASLPCPAGGPALPGGLPCRGVRSASLLCLALPLHSAWRPQAHTTHTCPNGTPSCSRRCGRRPPVHAGWVHGARQGWVHAGQAGPPPPRLRPMHEVGAWSEAVDAHARAYQILLFGPARLLLLAATSTAAGVAGAGAVLVEPDAEALQLALQGVDVALHGEARRGEAVGRRGSRSKLTVTLTTNASAGAQGKGSRRKCIF